MFGGQIFQKLPTMQHGISCQSVSGESVTHANIMSPPQRQDRHPWAPVHCDVFLPLRLQHQPPLGVYLPSYFGVGCYSAGMEEYKSGIESERRRDLRTVCMAQIKTIHIHRAKKIIQKAEKVSVYVCLESGGLDGWMICFCHRLIDCQANVSGSWLNQLWSIPGLFCHMILDSP